MRRPIGIFDSGVGGLTVARALRQELPGEDLVYLGDTARLPYGSKSPETVLRYTRSCARFLLARDVKLLVIACNTASAAGLPALADELAPVGVPVLGAVDPGAREAVSVTRNGHIGVIGTLATVGAHAYARAITALRPGLHVSELACPLLVPLAEEGWTEGDVPDLVARRYLGDLRLSDPDIDTIVLGCTHYPLLRPLLAEVAASRFGREVTLVDSASAMARVARDLLSGNGALDTAGSGTIHVFVTDRARLEILGPRFLGEDLGHVDHADI